MMSYLDKLKAQINQLDYEIIEADEEGRNAVTLRAKRDTLAEEWWAAQDEMARTTLEGRNV